VARYVSVPIRSEVFRELQRVEEELGLRSHSDAIKYLIQYLEKPIVIEVSGSVKPEEIMRSHPAIADAARDGRSVIFNVVIDHRAKKIYVTDRAAVIGVKTAGGDLHLEFVSDSSCTVTLTTS